MAAFASSRARGCTGPDTGRWHVCGPAPARRPAGFRARPEPSKGAPGAQKRGRFKMSTATPVCELLGIDHPIVSAPMAADPRLPAAVSNAGGLGTIGLWWVDDA